MRDDVEMLVPECRQQILSLAKYVRLEFQMSDAPIPSLGSAVCGKKDERSAGKPSRAELHRQISHLGRVDEVARGLHVPERPARRHRGRPKQRCDVAKHLPQVCPR